MNYFFLLFPLSFFSLAKEEGIKSVISNLHLFLISYLLTSFAIKRALYTIKITFWRGILNGTEVLLRFF